MTVAVENCQFEIAFSQFAVCSVSPGRADITMLNTLDTVDVPDGGWACVSIRTRAMGPRFEPTDCEALMPKLSMHRQVWTTQIPRSEIQD